MKRMVLFLCALAGWCAAVEAGEFRLAPPRPTLDRWNYPFNSQPVDRPVAPTYGSFDSRFDTRDAELLLGWDTASQLVTNTGPSRYLLRRVRITLTSIAPLAPIKPFVYDPTYDSYRTYLKAGSSPEAEPDADPGRPIELYGVGFRGGFTDETYREDSPFGPLGAITGSTISIGTRNAFGAMFDSRGELIDIANNVGQLNAGWTNAPFEVRPWAVGTTTDVAPGGEMPDGGKMSFDVDLGDPLVLSYLQSGLDRGRLRFMVSSLSPAGQSTPGGTGVGGAGAYPWWSNKENLVYDAPLIEIEGVLVGDEDGDGDGLPDDWERFWFGNLNAGASDDSDGDGASHRSEYLAGTSPVAGDACLRVTAFGRTPEGRTWLEFPFAASRRYAVETSGDWVQWRESTGQLTYPERGRARWVEDAVAGGTAVEEPVRLLRVRVL